MTLSPSQIEALRPGFEAHYRSIGRQEHWFHRHAGRYVSWIEREWQAWIAAKSSPVVVTSEMVEPYRIVLAGAGFEPQMRYTAGAVDGEFWYPLNSQGFWLEPDAFSLGNPKLHNFMSSREEAERVIERAKLINADEQIIRVAAPSGREGEDAPS